MFGVEIKVGGSHLHVALRCNTELKENGIAGQVGLHYNFPCQVRKILSNKGSHIQVFSQDAYL